MNKNIFNYFLNQKDGGLEYIQAAFIEAILIVNNEYGDSKWDYFVNVQADNDGKNPTVEVGYKGWEEPFSILFEYDPNNDNISVLELNGLSSYVEAREEVLFKTVDCGFGWFEPSDEDVYKFVKAIRKDWGQWRENN